MIMLEIKKKALVTAGLIAFLLCIASGATCASVHSKRVVSTARKLRSIISAPVARRSTIMFIIDGCRADILYDMIEGGMLPNIKGEVLDKGIMVKNAVTSIPSVTYCGTGSLLTGQYPGRADIVGNNWFDRSSLESRLYTRLKSFYDINEDTEATTIFQFISPLESAAIFTPLMKGASFVIKIDYNYIGMGNYILKRWDYVDRVYFQHFDDVITFSDKAGVFPSLTVIHLPSTDHIGHKFGNYSEEYTRIIRNFDELLGELVGVLDYNGVRDRISIIIVADHGQMKVREGNHFDICRELKKAGFRAPHKAVTKKMARKEGLYTAIKRKFSRSMDNKGEMIRHFRRYRVIYAVNGRCVYLYLRDVKDEEWRRAKDLPSWRERPSFEDLKDYPAGKKKRVNIIETFVEKEGVGFVVCRNNEGIEIFSKRGHGRIEMDGSNGAGAYRYTVVSGLDPLFYKDGLCSELIDGAFHSEAEWLACSASARYPGVVGQIGSLFRSPRCGDVVLFAAEGWDFEPEKKNRSAHGGFAREEIRIPFLWSGPDIESGEIEVIRSVDIFPTISEYLGVTKDRISTIQIDGASFLNEIISR